jgi:hypothetical protein
MVCRSWAPRSSGSSAQENDPRGCRRACSRPSRRCVGRSPRTSRSAAVPASRVAEQRRRWRGARRTAWGERQRAEEARTRGQGRRATRRARWWRRARPRGGARRCGPQAAGRGAPGKRGRRGPARRGPIGGVFPWRSWSSQRVSPGWVARSTACRLRGHKATCVSSPGRPPVVDRAFRERLDGGHCPRSWGLLDRVMAGG